MKKALAAILLLLFVAFSYYILQPLYYFSRLSQSHVEANMPSEQTFTSLMNRDLSAYFSKSLGPDVKVAYSLLRNGPTQSGIGYPKFYVWVRVFDRGTMIDRGAARVAAINKERFHVTDFLGQREIERDPQSIYSVFPKPVCKKIEELLKK